MKNMADTGGTFRLSQAMLERLLDDGIFVPTARQWNNPIHGKIHFGRLPDNHDDVLDNVLPAIPKIALLSALNYVPEQF